MNDKQELIREVADAALIELQKLQQRHVKVSSPVEIVKELFKGIRDPQPVAETIIPVSSLPVVAPEFPRLLASYAEKKLEYIVINNFAEWAPYHSWHTVFPPQQAASRPITTTLEAEIERLRSEGARERPREEHEQRRQTKGYTE